MNPAGRWERYGRDGEGAWHAIDDLRDVVGELVDQRDLANSRRFTTLQLSAVVAAGVASFTMVCGLILAFVPHA